MEIITTLLSPDVYIEPLRNALGWVFWMGLFVLLLVALRRWRSFNKPMNNQRWGILIVLSLLVPLTSLFIGFRLPAGVISPPPGVPVDPQGPAVMVFSMIPWMLAAGMLGPTSAVGLALFSGFIQALWGTHNLFTPLVLAVLAVLFAFAVNQRYRTALYGVIRHPLAAALTLAILYPFLYLAITPFSILLPSKYILEYILNNIGIFTLVMGIELFMSGLFTEIITTAIPETWGGEGQLLPSPVERTLQARLVYILAPLVLLLVVTLMVGDWYFAGKAARDMLSKSMTNSAEVAAQNVPYFFEMGQIIVQDIAANQDLIQSLKTNQLYDTLAESIIDMPFFDQLLVYDQNAVLLSAYPDDDFTGTRMPLNEKFGIASALGGFPYQTFSLPPDRGNTSAQISFVVPIVDDAQEVQGVLVGRTNLSNNLVSKPIITSLSSMRDVDGNGYLLDEEKNILFHPNSDLVMTEYTGITLNEAGQLEGFSHDGTRSLIYYQPVEGYPWAIVFMVPEIQADQLSVMIAIPLLAMLVFLSIIGIIILRVGLQNVTGSLKKLATGVGRISEGDLNKPLSVAGEDEVGQLGQSFEEMRISIKSRLEELNNLVDVSQGVASSLNLEEALQSVLKAALVTGASSARIVLPPDVVPELNGDQSSPLALGAEPSEFDYGYLDEQMLAYARRHNRLVLSSLSRPRLFNLPAEVAHPASLIALALSEESTYLGVLWIAYDNAHTFSNEEVSYMTNLARQASAAASNTRLYLNAEVERQQLSAIFSSSPDPIIVVDQKDRLVVANPAAWQILDMNMDYVDENSIEDIISQKELVNLMRSPSEEPQTIEVSLPDRQVYLATATPVISKGERVGRVCILTDVTRLKELNALKSEFVSTVSHDMRYPLTLIHGYASMVEMVGQLNDQQTNYLNKIIENVEAMSHLVNNLLDLRRIEAGIGLHIEMIPVRDVVDEVINSLNPQAAQKRIQLDTKIPVETVPLIEADQALLQKAIYNLVENAIKYTPKDGEVAIFVHGKDDRINFEISDTGVGISPVDQAQLFEKFYHRPKKEGLFEPSGSGMGLAIVKSIADRHGGQVWVKSQLGKGSTFYLAIPLRQPGMNEI